MGIGPLGESGGEAGKQGVAHFALGSSGIVPAPRCPVQVSTRLRKQLLNDSMAQAGEALTQTRTERWKSGREVIVCKVGSCGNSLVGEF